MNGMSKSMSRPNIAAPGEAFNTVWYVEQSAHAALSMTVSMSAGSTESAMSSSEVRIMVPKTWWMRSQMAFTCEFLIVVGLRFMPYKSHNVSKCNLNSDPLLCIKYWHLGYLHNQILLTNWLVWSDDLSKICSLIVLSLPLTILVINHMIVGNSTTSNQLEAGLIMVRAMKSIDKPSLPLSVYWPTKLTHKASHGVLITILDGRCPYFCVRFYSLGKSCMTSLWIGWCFSFLSSILQLSLSLQDGYAQGAGDSGDTTWLQAVARALVLRANLYCICNFCFQ